MSIKSSYELESLKKISGIVAYTLKEMIQYAKVGMTTKELDTYGGEILKKLGAKSAPFLTYKFPGYTCISVNKEFCHGIPSFSKILQEGDLINIDVSAELNGFWSDNGSSFVLGKDLNQHTDLVEASKYILKKAIKNIKSGVKISDIGELIEKEANQKGYRVIKNLSGHGVGSKLHEEPFNLLNYKNIKDPRKFSLNSVIALETFIATTSDYAYTTKDGWTMVGNKEGYMAQHEHTLVVTDKEPLVLTELNGI